MHPFIGLVVLVVTITLLILYSTVILSFYRGWRRNKTDKHIAEIEKSVSVIIPYKDEASRLEALIKSISSLDYPQDKLEVVFINDQSSDNGSSIIEDFRAKYSGNLKHLETDKLYQGKKAAVKRASISATNELLLFCDADCTFGPKWVRSMSSAFSSNTQMVQGPVLIHPALNSVGRIQQIEFLSLMMSSAGSIANNKAILASAANLAIRKEVYLEAHGHLKDQIHTGDDMFLMEFIKTKYHKGISFNQDQEAIVKTASLTSFKELWNQRKRWTSKTLNYTDLEIIGTAIIVFGLNLLVLTLLFLGFSETEMFLWALIVFLIKTLADLPLILSGIRFYNIRKGLVLFLLTQLIYPFYVVTVPVFGVLGNFKWKDRNRKGL